MPSDTPEELAPTLHRATETLKEALGEACKSNVERIDTGELIRVEEVLAIANEAAKEAISVRRRMKGMKLTQARQPGDPVPAQSREFADPAGSRWVVFAVHPTTARSGRHALAERFAAGWLTFDSGTETRRLAPIPADWHLLADGELAALCRSAEPATRSIRRAALDTRADKDK